MPALERCVARLSTPGGGYCSGVLIGPDVVLTCAHFFAQREASSVSVRVDASAYPLDSLSTVRGTDVALVRLPQPVEASPVPLGPLPRPLSRTMTLGFGGRSDSVQTRPGLFLGTLPLSWSRTGATRVRPAGLLYANPPAVKGDSGGPVLAGGKVVGVQSLILDPWGRNLRIATVALWPVGLAAALRGLGKRA